MPSPLELRPTASPSLSPQRPSQWSSSAMSRVTPRFAVASGEQPTCGRRSAVSTLPSLCALSLRSHSDHSPRTARGAAATMERQRRSVRSTRFFDGGRLPLPQCKPTVTGAARTHLPSLRATAWSCRRSWAVLLSSMEPRTAAYQRTSLTRPPRPPLSHGRRRRGAGETPRTCPTSARRRSTALGRPARHAKH